MSHKYFRLISTRIFHEIHPNLKKKKKKKKTEWSFRTFVSIFIPSESCLSVRLNIVDDNAVSPSPFEQIKDIFNMLLLDGFEVYDSIEAKLIFWPLAKSIFQKGKKKRKKPKPIKRFKSLLGSKNGRLIPFYQ